MIKELKNKDMKHLLSNTDEEIELNIIDIRAATWDKTSVTQDMRDLNTQRVMQEITRRIRDAVDTHERYFHGQTQVDMREATQRLLQGYKDMGAIVDFQIVTIERTWAESGRVETVVEACITQNVNFERVNIEINLRP